jgi:hypothetical protein
MSLRAWLLHEYVNDDVNREVDEVVRGVVLAETPEAAARAAGTEVNAKVRAECVRIWADLGVTIPEQYELLNGWSMCEVPLFQVPATPSKVSHIAPDRRWPRPA